MYLKSVVRAASIACLTFILSSVTTSNAKQANIVKPEKVGMSSTRLSKISVLGDRYVQSGHYSGVVTLIARKGKVVHSKAHGRYGVANQKKLEEDTLFRIYSMTKPITAVAAMILYEEGKFQMNDPVSKYLPEFSEQKILIDGELHTPKSPMKMRQLFTHTAGLTYGFSADNPVEVAYQKAKLFESKDLSEFSSKVAALPLRYQPGTRYQYSVSMDILGAVIEKLSGMPLDQFYHTRVFTPLDMTDTFFEVPADKANRLASDQFWDASSNRVMDMPVDQQRRFDKVTLFMGGGGLISTAGDYFRFAQMILNGGELDGKRILSPKTVEYLSLNHLTDAVRNEGEHDLHAGQSMALGFGVVTNPALMPAISSKGELSWAGLAGTKFWIDPSEELIGIALVQLYSSPWPLRYDMKAATYQAISELHEN